MGSCRVEQRPTYAVDASIADSVSDLESAQATPNREQVTVRGTVEAVDVKARTITLGGDGNAPTLDVPKSVERLDEVKVGDVVSAVYYDQVTITQHPAGAPDNDRLEPPIATPTPGALPAAPSRSGA